MLKFVFVALLALSFNAGAVLAAGAPEPAPATRAPRVRPYDGRSAWLLLRGLEQSRTFRQIVDQLEASNVIAFVEMQPALPRLLAGRMVWLSSAAGYRYVRISLNPTLSADALVSVLGHELRHALEVASTPAIVDEPSLEAFYAKNGISMRAHAGGWDTQAARDAGELVRREIGHRAVVERVESVARFDPSDWFTVYRRALDKFAKQ